MDIERIGEIAMEIIAYAGTAKSHCILALQSAKRRDFEDVQVHFQSAEEGFQQAHHMHKELLEQEMDRKQAQVSMLLMHAEDQLMSAETIRFVVQEFIELIQEKERVTHGNL